ncbi:hypothetical protein ACYSNW_09240 [Enterococcus sp. LJL99]
MKIKIIQKAIVFFQLAKIVEKMSTSKYIVKSFCRSLLAEVGSTFVGSRTAVITDSKIFGKALFSSMLAIDGQMTVQARYDLLNNGENK